MASNSLPTTPSQVRARAEVDTAWETIKKVLAPVASLKLTVGLFILSIFLVLAGTLAQVEQDMWEIINNYFHSGFVWIPPAILIPVTWASDLPSEQIVIGLILLGAFIIEVKLFFSLSNAISQKRGIIRVALLGFAMGAGLVYTITVLATRWIPFPGGLALGSLLFVNLLAAHSVRFKRQAKGLRLVIGLVMLPIAVRLIWNVIASGHNGDGLQGEPPIAWATMWLYVKLGVAVAAGILSLGFLATLKRTSDRSVEIIAFGVSAVAAIALALWLFLSGVYLGDSGMRILWQLIKCGGAALVLLIACLLIFKKRGGIVMIHCGIGLLMLGELFVGTFVAEERIAVDEGETVSHAIDIRSTELAIVNSSKPDEDDVVVVPLWVKGRKSSFLKDGKTIQSEELPFDIEVVDYYRNSDLKDVGASANNKATAGKGLRTVAQEVRGGSGADSSSEVDMSSAYVRFLEKGTSEEIGTYLLSQVVMRSRGGGQFTFDETIPAGGKDYHVELRFKRTYKPYSIRLIDVRKDDYIGTSTPRNYSSDVQLVDDSRNVDREVKIWMNNPLRYAGETFYQSGYHADPSGVESTTLQVVKNTGWMIPYVSCVLVMFGMFAHFSGTLLRFLRRVATNPAKIEPAGDAPIVAEAAMPAQPTKKRRVPKRKRPEPSEPVELPLERQSFQPASNTAVIAFTAVVVLLFGGWLAGKARPAKVDPGEMDVVAFGKLPLVFEGRIKPFDTLARNSLRVMSTKEQLKDNSGQKQPAIVWLLDVITGVKAGTKHNVFKIDNLELLNTLKLTRRKGGLYSMDEIEPQMDEFRKQVQLAGEVAADQLSIYQRKVLELDRKLQLFFKIREAFRMPPDGLPADEEASYLVGMANVSEQLSASPVPYAIPTADEQQSWEPFVTAVTRLWAKDIAKEYGSTTTRELSEKLTAEILSDDNIDELVETRLLGMIKSLADQNLPPEQLDAYAREALVRMPADVRERVTSGIRDDIAANGREVQATLSASLDTALGEGGLAAAEDPVARSMWDMLKSYRDSDELAFSRALESYRGALAANAPDSLNTAKTNFEAAFNHFAPFYHCAALYVFAFVLTGMGWLAWVFRWNRPFNYAAFGLITLTFVVHSLALAGRIYISGRPPVTNLYSSAIFIGWGGVVLGLAIESLFRIGIGNAKAAIAGFSTLVIAHQLAGDGDTFTVLQAVLDTQFWLATHVVTITLGYATTFSAGILGIWFVLAGMGTPVLSLQVGQQPIRKALAGMIYGIICFAMFFSFVGTVLGGLWADDSWGRFWGWDPKENGALMIVLWNALVLHARWGGLVRDRGLALLAIGGNIVTAWSWFGVNELGVGLHAYGFTEGVVPTLLIFWLSQLAIIGVGLLPTTMWWSYKEEERLKQSKSVRAQVAT